MSSGPFTKLHEQIKELQARVDILEGASLPRSPDRDTIAKVKSWIKKQVCSELRQDKSYEYKEAVVDFSCTVLFYLDTLDQGEREALCGEQKKVNEMNQETQAGSPAPTICSDAKGSHLPHNASRSDDGCKCYDDIPSRPYKSDLKKGVCHLCGLIYKQKNTATDHDGQ